MGWGGGVIRWRWDEVEVCSGGGGMRWNDVKVGGLGER